MESAHRGCRLTPPPVWRRPSRMPPSRWLTLPARLRSRSTRRRSVWSTPEEKRVEADEDLAKTERDVQRDLAKQAEDSAERIIDAQRAVTDAREDARRAERDGARDLADARSAYQDALLGSLDEDNPFKAQRDREKALLELQRTETDVAESNEDAAKNVAEAEEKLRDTHVEAAENRAEAEERATEQYRGCPRAAGREHRGAARGRGRPVGCHPRG